MDCLTTMPNFTISCVTSNSSLSKRMAGWVGDTSDGLSLSLFADADFAGCSKSLRSTSGSHMHIQREHPFPIVWRQQADKCA